MFKKFTLKNYRTHIDTTLELKGVTLFIGGNNSGKTNLLNGVQHFAQLISRTGPQSDTQFVANADYFPHKHSLDTANTPMVFACEWEKETGKVNYQIALYALDFDAVACQEKIEISLNDDSFSLEQGYTEVSQEIVLRTQLEKANLNAKAKQLGEDFFQSLTQVYSYNLHPHFLNGLLKPLNEKEIDYANVNIARDLGQEGANFQALLKYVVEQDQETYKRLLEFLTLVVPAFQGLVIKDEQVFWQLEITKNTGNFQYLPPTAISDGFTKGCALVLLCASKNPPALILIDEVENSISLENVRELLSWLRHASGKGQKMQFILTTHSLNFLRRFSDDLEAVYNVSLVSRNYNSLITNFNEALLTDVKMDRINGDIRKQDGKELVKIPHYQMTDLFYSGVLLNL
ncbi:MAG: AAA family ATPase [Candidatus Parabeggiatoa sp.]|nr:AAA family ATPase [Candidatus Parabeggiatoa sp.]